MKSICLSALFALAAVPAYVSSAALPTIVNTSPGYFKLDIERRQPSSGLLRRDVVSSSMCNYEDGVGYMAELSIGTPAQTVKVQVDTGSSDMWVRGSHSVPVVNSSCSVFMDFDASKSSTFSATSDKFNVRYGGGYGANGSYALDTVSIGGVAIDNMRFGYATKSDAPTAIMGIGYPQLEGTTDKYANLPLRLKKDGKIAINAYSLWFNELNSSSGSILFGGIDKAKFSGDLQTIDIQPYMADYYLYMNVTMTGMTVHDDTGDKVLYQDDSSALAQAADRLYTVLDSGSTMTSLPESLVKNLIEALGLKGQTSSDSSGTIYVPCSFADSTSTVEFEFGGSASYSVPMSDFVLQMWNETTQSNTCAIGVSSSASPTYIIGDSVLRSAYIVHDLENNKIGLAQAAYNDESDIYTMTSTGIPKNLKGSTKSSGSASSTTVAAASASATTTSGANGRTAAYGFALFMVIASTFASLA